MKTKHTPGEWYQSHRKQNDGMYSTQVYDKEGETICTLEWYPVDEGNGVTSTAREANAKLIAAAPDLLEALKSLQAILCDCEGNPCFEGSEGDEIVAQKAFETIKKATS